MDHDLRLETRSGVLKLPNILAPTHIWLGPSTAGLPNSRLWKCVPVEQHWPHYISYLSWLHSDVVTMFVTTAGKLLNKTKHYEGHGRMWPVWLYFLISAHVLQLLFYFHIDLTIHHVLQPHYKSVKPFISNFNKEAILQHKNSRLHDTAFAEKCD